MNVVEVDEGSIYSNLCNYSKTPFVDYNGLRFNSVINAYYYHILVGRPDLQRSVRYADSIDEIIRIIGFDLYSDLSKPLKHRSRLDIDWTRELMTSLLFHKLNQNSECVEMLMATWNSRIVVINGHDNVLGAGKARFGLNMTGEILTELRGYFRLIRREQNLRIINTDYDRADEDPIG